MALCVQADIEQRLQWDITAEPEPVITTLIAAAQAHIESEIGRTVESAARAETLNPSSPTLFLQYWPATTITTLTEDGTSLTEGDDFILEDEIALKRVSDGHQINWQTTKLASIAVAYVGGYLAGTHDSELAHLGSVCAEIVARAFRTGAAAAAAPAGVGAGGITSVALEGSDTVTYSTANGETIETGGGLSRFVHLLEDERRQLARYRTPAIA